MTDAQETADPHAGAGVSGAPRPNVLLPVATFLATGLLLFPSSGRDDVYITYGPARALAETGSISNWNGAAVEQSSSLLDVVLLAGLTKLLPLELPLLGWLLSVLAGAGCVLLSAVAVRRLGPEYRSAPWLVATATPLVYWSFSGMETSLAALLGLGLALAWSEYLRQAPGRWPPPTTCLVTLLFLAVRPESVFVLLCVVAGGCLLSFRARSGSPRHLTPAHAGSLLRLGVVTTCGAAALAAYRAVAFGSFFPQPASAKSFTRLGGSNTLIQLLDGLDYITAQAGSIFHAALWLGAIASAASIALALQRRTPPVFEAIGGLLCCAIIAFVATTGGDYMEGARYLVPALPVLLLLASALIHRHLPQAAAPAVAILVGLQLLGSAGFARSESTGVPVWDWGDLARTSAAEPERDYSWLETANRVHIRDMPLIDRLSQLVAVIDAGGAPLTLLSKQMGMVPYHLAAQREGRVRFIDAYGLATRHVTDPGFAPLRADWRRDRWNVLWQRGPELERLWGTSRPDLIYDLGAPPPELEAHGYFLAFRQTGELRVKSLLFPGSRVSANAWIAVRSDHRAAVAAAASKLPPIL